MLYDLENGNTMIVEPNKDDPELTLYIDDRGINIKIELQILYNKIMNQHYICNRNNTNVYHWENTTNEIVNFIIKYTEVFVKKVKLIDKLNNLEIATWFVPELNKKIYSIRLRTIENSSGLSKEEIDFFNDSIKKYYIKI